MTVDLSRERLTKEKRLSRWELENVYKQERHAYLQRLTVLVYQAMDSVDQWDREERLKLLPKEALLQWLGDQYSNMPESWAGNGYHAMTKTKLIQLLCEL